MKDVCIAYADKSGNGFSVSEPWIEDNFNTLEDCEQKANDLKEEGYQHVILFYKGEEELESCSLPYFDMDYLEKHVRPEFDEISEIIPISPEDYQKSIKYEDVCTFARN